MTWGNLIKKIQNAYGGLLDSLSIERKLNNIQMEWVQFDICDYDTKQVEVVPFFHYEFEFFFTNGN